MNIHQPSPLNRTVDYATEWGAKALAARIVAYWAKRGFYPKVWVEALLTTSSPAANEHLNYVVKSDMVRGWPQ
jgi:hypothetical protein